MSLIKDMRRWSIKMSSLRIEILNTNGVKPILNKIKEQYIDKCLNGRIRTIGWNDRNSMGEEILEFLAKNEDDYKTAFCGLERLEKIKNNNSQGTMYANNYKMYKTPRIGALHFRKDWWYRNFYSDLFPLLEQDIKNFIGDHHSENKLVESNSPLWYTEHEGIPGHMSWHTNCNNPGWRFYLVYNTDENTSFFRYINTDGDMITELEPKGWILNGFYASDCDNKLWHSVYTKTNRFSFGMRIDDEDWSGTDFDKGKIDSSFDGESWR